MDAAHVDVDPHARRVEDAFPPGNTDRRGTPSRTRVISDLTTIAYLGDVFVLPEHRGRGLGKWLIECVMSHPELQGLRRWVLATRDAQGLYRRYGFTPLKKPEVFMERHDPDVYRRR